MLFSVQLFYIDLIKELKFQGREKNVTFWRVTGEIMYSSLSVILGV